MSDPLDDYLERARSAQLEELIEWLRIPSISTLPAHKADVQAAAAWLAANMQKAGLHHVEVIHTASQPMVYADWLAAGPDKPTLLIYGHFDVQPVDPLEQWQSPPFAPEVRAAPQADSIYARGAADDKGQTFIHVKAVEALLQTTGALPVNVKFLVEGEEESGSVAIGAYVPEHATKLQADAALISDTHILAPDRPALLYGLRGMWVGEVTVTVAAHDLHSGSYGGAVHNANQALCELLSALHDANGRVTVSGFYDNVRVLDAEERRRLAAIPYGDVEIRAESGAFARYGEPGFSAIERTGARPTLEINGMWGGFIGEGFKTVIPCQAHAKISCRLVPDQDPERIGRLVTNYLQQIAPNTVHVDVVAERGSRAYLSAPDSPAMQAAAVAYAESFGAPPVYLLEGGGIPIVNVFQSVLKTPIVLMGFGLPDDNLHAPNEKLFLPNFYRGIQASIAFIREFAAVGKSGAQ